MECEYILYCNPPATYWGLECNKGIDAVLGHLEDFRPQDRALRVVDTTRMSEQELQTAYIRAIIPSVLKKYRVRGIFGTHRYAGSKFGRAVPALVVQDPSGTRVVDVFPHEELGRIVTIHDALTRATPSGAGIKQA